PVLVQGLVATLLLSSGALLLFYLFPSVVVGITYGPKFLPAAGYIFAYGLAMTSLAGTSVVTTYKIGVHRFGYVLPLALVAGAEVALIHVFHKTLWDIVFVLLAGHTLAFALCSLRIFEPTTQLRTKGKMLFDAIR